MSKSSKKESLSSYTIPSLTSPKVSFHPSHTGSSARNALLFESIAGTLEGLLVIYYAEPILRFFASASLSPSHYPTGVSAIQIIGAVIVGIHLPLALGVPARRTNVEGRVILQAYFEVVELLVAGFLSWMAWRGEESTGMRPQRLMMLAGAILFFGVVRIWTVFVGVRWAGAYRVEGKRE